MSVDGSVATITSGQIRQLTGLTDRGLHNWCHNGVLGDNHRTHPGSGNRRVFQIEDLAVALTCMRVSLALSSGSVRRYGCRLELLCDVAEQVRAGAKPVTVDLGPGVTLTVTVSDPAPLLEEL